MLSVKTGFVSYRSSLRHTSQTYDRYNHRMTRAAGVDSSDPRCFLHRHHHRFLGYNVSFP